MKTKQSLVSNYNYLLLKKKTRKKTKFQNLVFNNF